MRVPGLQSLKLGLWTGRHKQHESDKGIERRFVEERDIKDDSPVAADIVVEDPGSDGPAYGGVHDAVQDRAVAFAVGAGAEDAAAEGGAVEGSALLFPFCFCGCAWACALRE